MAVDILSEIRAAVLDGDPALVTDLTRQAVEQGIPALTIVEEGLTEGIREVGDGFQQGHFFLPDLIRGAHSMEAALAILEPLLSDSGDERKVLGRVVLGTVHGDLHSIGKNIVGALLKASGFQVEDLGINVPVADFVGRVRDTGGDIIALSALLTTTVGEQERVIGGLRDAGLREGIAVMVGGAPIDQAWADRIGADGYAPDAAGAVMVARELVKD